MRYASAAASTCVCPSCLPGCCSYSVLLWVSTIFWMAISGIFLPWLAKTS